MARKRNEEYIGEDDDGEFEEEPVDSYEDPPDFVDEVTDEGEPRIQKCGERFSLCICITVDGAKVKSDEEKLQNRSINSSLR